MRADTERKPGMADNSAISEIMRAVDAESLFSDNRKRAGIIYRRLMRLVHPDIDPSPEAAEAATRLNSLWESWHALYDHDHTSAPASAGDARHRQGSRLRKISKVRTTTGATAAVLFHDDAKTGSAWMQMWSQPSTGKSMRLGSDLLEAVNAMSAPAKDSPVLMPGNATSIIGMQSDGPHEAVRWTLPKPLDMGWTAGQLRDSREYWQGVGGRDIIWILKRLLYIDGLLNNAGLSLDPAMDAADSVIIAPQAHTVAFASPLSVKKGDDKGRPVLQVAARLIGSATGGEAQRLRMFINGCMGDEVSSSQKLMEELDYLAEDLYGKPSYHPMKDPMV